MCFLFFFLGGWCVDLSRLGDEGFGLRVSDLLGCC